MCTCPMCENGKHLGVIARFDNNACATFDSSTQCAPSMVPVVGLANRMSVSTNHNATKTNNLASLIGESQGNVTHNVAHVLPKPAPLHVARTTAPTAPFASPVMNQMSVTMMGQSSFPGAIPMHVIRPNGSRLLLDHPWPPRYVNHRSRERPKCNCPLFEHWFLVSRHLAKHPGRPPHAENCRLHPRNAKKTKTRANHNQPMVRKRGIHEL